MERSSKIRATPLQKGLVFNAIASPNSGVDSEHVTISCSEMLDLARLEDCWNTVISRHCALRTGFGLTAENEIEVSVKEKFRIPRTSYDWSGKSAEQIKSAQSKIMFDDRLLGFPLDSEPPMRLLTCKLATNTYWVLWSFHHAILDGRSFSIVLNEIFALYDFSDARKYRNPQEFSVYASGIDACDRESQSEYWKKKLESIESDCKVPNLHAHASSAVLYSKNQALVKGCLSRSESNKLRAFAESAGVGVHALVQACWCLLLHHYTGNEYVIFGDTRALRHAVPNTKDSVGLLINTLPFPVQVTKQLTTKLLLEQISATQRDIRSVETTSLSDLIAQRSGQQLFGSMIMFDSQTLDSRLRSIAPERFANRHFEYQGQTNYPLSLIAYDEPEIEFQIEFDTREYGSINCERILAQFKNLMIGLESNWDTPAIEIPYLATDELAKLEIWNQSERPYDLEYTLVGLFESQVKSTPDAIALKFGQDSVTYSEFNKRVNQLAHYLVKRGVSLDEVVPVCCDRSIEMMVAIYAIIKAGGAYLPIDTHMPVERSKFILQDSNAKFLLGHKRYLTGISADGCANIEVDSAELWQQSPEGNLGELAEPNCLAYTLYTSGSTGQPKGVMNEHRGIVNRLLWMQDAFKLDCNDVVLQKTPYTFDVSVWELFWPLLFGARLVIAEPDGHKDSRYLVNCIIEESVSTLHFVPSMLQLFLEDLGVIECRSLKRVICSGEALTTKLQSNFFDVLSSSELHNLYGPTEAAIDVTWWECDRLSELNFVPIGKVIANTQIHILDQNLLPVPIGVSGELFIAGVQVARGYLNRPELTAERFIENPYFPGTKMYRSGDLARYMEDGSIEYIGRTDFQVKIRGQRIELGEVESALLSNKAVSEVVVTASTDLTGEQILVAYVVGSDVQPEVLKRHAADFLTNYMVPSLIIVLDKFELNSSGKVDRKKLPLPEFKTLGNDSTGNESYLELEIQSIWSTLLGRQINDINQSYFDAGGNSLSIMRLSRLLSDRFSKPVSVQDVLRESTIATQANFLLRGSTAIGVDKGAAKKNAAQQKLARTKLRNRKRVRQQPAN